MHDTYDKMRNELASRLVGKMPAEEIKKVLKAMDTTADHYNIGSKEMALTVASDYKIEMLETYLACGIIRDLSTETIKNAGITLKNFFYSVGKAPGEVTTNDIRLYLDKYKRFKDVDFSTLDKYRQSINAFFAWAVNEEYLTKNPCAKVDKIKFEAKEREFLTPKEMLELRKACANPREKAVVEVLYSTGCRVSELINIKVSDINFDSQLVRVLGKGKKWRTVRLSLSAMDVLTDYLEFMGDKITDYIFCSIKAPYGKVSKGRIEKMLKQIAERTKIEKPVTPHVIRHTTATDMLRNGTPIDVVQKYLGHASVSTTQIYAKTADDSVYEAHARAFG